MFSFLNPIFLWAAAAAAIPLILHMMQKYRVVRIPFSTIRFLKMASSRSSRRIRLENFLLLLLRTLMLLLIALALAMPVLRATDFGKFIGRSQRDIAIIVDNSYSMNYSSGKESAWDKALGCALAIVDGLENGDRACVFVAGDDVKPVVAQLSADREYVSSQVKSMRPGSTASVLRPAVQAAIEALLQDDRRREREVHIITDGQTLPWKKPAEAQEYLSGLTDDDKTTFFVTLTGARQPANIAPMDITLQPDLIMPDTAPRVQARISNSGQACDSHISVIAGDEEVASRAVTITENGMVDVSFVLPPLPAGTHAVRIESMPDGLPQDDAFYFLIKVREQLPVLCVGSSDDNFFVMKAMQAAMASSSALQTKQVRPDQVENEALDSYSCVLLCNALPLPGQAIVKLERYIESGGLMVLFPGDGATLADYKSWRCLPWTPDGLKNFSDKDRQQTLRWNIPQHPMLRDIPLQPGSMPVLNIRQLLKSSDKVKETESLILAGSNDPFLSSRPFGDGNVLMFAIAADRSWSNFPLTPIFLPLIHQVVLYGAGSRSEAPFLWLQKELSLADQMPTATADTSLFDPDGNRVILNTHMEDGVEFLSAGNLRTPGVYLESLPGTSGSTPVFALNLDRTESDLTLIEQENIQKILGAEKVFVAADIHDLQKLIEDHRIGREFAEVLLWLLLILSAIEFLYANQKSREAPKLSETLGIKLTGKVG